MPFALYTRFYKPILLLLISWPLFIGYNTLSKEVRTPYGLMVDLLSKPEEAVITNPTPSFGWIVSDTSRGAKQSAYQIIVASNQENLTINKVDIWDSGKIISDQSVEVPFAGVALQSNNTYWWKVRTWNKEGSVSDFSKAQKFNTGDLGEVARKWPGESRWVELPDGKFVFENRHPIKYHDIKPASIKKNTDNNNFISFEKAAFGTLKLKLYSENENNTIVIHLGEKKSETNNKVDTDPGGSVAYNKVKLNLKKGLHEYQVELPRKHSKYPNSQVLADHMPEVTCFRYVEIQNYQGTLSKNDVIQKALFYEFDDSAAEFHSSDPTLNQVWELCKYTLKATPFLGLYIDGNRERMPYEADAYIQQISHYAVDREYAIGRYTNQFLIFNPAWPTEWHLHVVLMAWADYMQTGNKSSIEKYYEDLKAKTLLKLAREDGLISTRTGLVTKEFLKEVHYNGNSFRDIVDWPQGTPFNQETKSSGFGSVRIEGETDRFVFSDINTVVNAFHYRNLVLMSKIAQTLDKQEDAEFFKTRAEKVKAAFNNILLDKEKGVYVDGEGVAHSSLHANMFPVAFGLAPEEYYDSILNLLKSKGMACSPYGAPYLLTAIYKLGDPDYGFNLITAETDRSWMNMINFGSTMTSEAWDIKYKGNMTWNHAWGASPAYIISRKLMGIEPLEPAFKKIQIKPQPGNLRQGKIKSPTIRGPVMVSFENDPGKSFLLDFQIPANTTARVAVPINGKEDFTLTLNGKEVNGVIQDGFVVIDSVVAGKHQLLLQ
jgi:alpha-L-rhamnosidase